MDGFGLSHWDRANRQGLDVILVGEAGVGAPWLDLPFRRAG
jgi:hypothetical protein